MVVFKVRRSRRTVVFVCSESEMSVLAFCVRLGVTWRIQDRRLLHTRHSLLQMARHRVYQIAAGHEDRNSADSLRIDPALRLAIGKEHDVRAASSMLSRLENEVLGKVDGRKARTGAASEEIPWEQTSCMPGKTGDAARKNTKGDWTRPYR